jgi:hypothetical protein
MGEVLQFWRDLHIFGNENSRERSVELEISSLDLSLSAALNVIQGESQTKVKAADFRFPGGVFRRPKPCTSIATLM